MCMLQIIHRRKNKMDEQIDSIGEAVRAEITRLANAMLAQGVGIALCIKLAAHQVREASALDAAKLNKRHGQLAKSKQNVDKQVEAMDVMTDIQKHRLRYQAALAEWLKANAKIDASLEALVPEPISQNQVTMPSEVAGARPRDDGSDSPTPKVPGASDDDTQPVVLPQQ